MIFRDCHPLVTVIWSRPSNWWWRPFWGNYDFCPVLVIFCWISSFPIFFAFLLLCFGLFCFSTFHGCLYTTLLLCFSTVLLLFFVVHFCFSSLNKPQDAHEKTKTPETNTKLNPKPTPKKTTATLSKPKKPKLWNLPQTNPKPTLTPRTKTTATLVIPTQAPNLELILNRP